MKKTMAKIEAKPQSPAPTLLGFQLGYDHRHFFHLNNQYPRRRFHQYVIPSSNSCDGSLMIVMVAKEGEGALRKEEK